MKKLLAGMAAVAMFASCSQNEEFEKVEQKAEIKIGTIVSKTTRVAEASDATLESNGFTLYAYNTAAKEMKDVTANGLNEVFIAGKAVSHTTKWTIADGPYYWLLDENLQFFAYSPATNVSSWTATGQYPSFSYTVPNNQEDLLAATAYNAKKVSGTAQGALTLTFKHILTQINFKLKGKDAGFKYTVTKVELKGVANTGTYTYDLTTSAWSGQSGEANYVYDAESYSEIDGVGESTIAGSNLGLMLLPNEDLSKVKIVVTYSTTYNGKSVFNGSKEVTPTGTWGIGQKILYTLTLPGGAEEITVSPTIDTWNAQSGTQGEFSDPTVTPAL